VGHSKISDNTQVKVAAPFSLEKRSSAPKASDSKINLLDFNLVLSDISLCPILDVTLIDQTLGTFSELEEIELV